MNEPRSVCRHLSMLIHIYIGLLVVRFGIACLMARIIYVSGKLREAM